MNIALGVRSSLPSIAGQELQIDQRLSLLSLQRTSSRTHYTELGEYKDQELSEGSRVGHTLQFSTA